MKQIITTIILLAVMGCNPTAKRLNVISSQVRTDKIESSLQHILLNAQYAARQGKYTTAYRYNPDSDISDIVKFLKGKNMQFKVLVDSNEIFKTIILEW
jgi:Tfp pilus assembly protein PilP